MTTTSPAIAIMHDPACILAPASSPTTAIKAPTIHQSILVAACAILIAILALFATPDRAHAHDGIPGTTGTGTYNDPVLVDEWPEFKAALELEENLFIRVINTSGKMTKDFNDKPLIKVSTGGTYITVPEGYAKEVDYEGRTEYAGTTAGVDQFGTFILNKGALTIYGADTKARLLVGSTYNGLVTAIRNEGELYVYGEVSIDATDEQDYTKACAIGIHCASDNAKLVISGSMSNDSGGHATTSNCYITGAAMKNLADGIGGGVYVERARSVDIFGGHLMSRYSTSTGFTQNGLVINTNNMSDLNGLHRIKIHGGVAQGLTFVGTNAKSFMAPDVIGWGKLTCTNPDFMWNNYYLNKNEYTDGHVNSTPFWQFNHFVELQVKPLTSTEGWNTISNAQSFTAGDGVTYSIAFGYQDGKEIPAGLGAQAYPTYDKSVVMTPTPVLPVLYRASDSASDLGACKALPTLMINSGAFQLMNGAETNITSVELPGQLSLIGTSAFAGTDLKSITIPNSVTVIQESAFEDSKLEQVGGMFSIQYIEDDAFTGSHLQEISCGSTGSVNIAPHAYGYFVNSEGEYEMNDPCYVHAIPDSPFWNDAVKKGFIADLRKATVAAISEQFYTGYALTPKPTVTVNNDLGTVTLVEGIDYKLSYEKNKNTGTATIDITAIEPKSYGGVTTTFKISKMEDKSAWIRLKGDIALDTMSAIVDEGAFPKNDTVVLTTVDGYWDALTAAGIAGMSGAPILMTNGTTLSDQTSSQIKKLKPKTIIICGGNAAVSDGVAYDARKAAGESVAIMRCWGENAVGTAIEIFNQAPTITGRTWSSTAFVCTNEGYWDALAAAPISYSRQMPIFLTNGAYSIDASVVSAMKAGGVTNAWIVGGPLAIDDGVITQLQGAGITVNGRLSGETAIETSEEVATFGLKRGMSTNYMGAATTNGYWDALAGAALCGKKGSVLVLVKDENSHSISGFVASHAAGIAIGYFFGGEAAISIETGNALINASAGKWTPLTAASF